MKALAFVYLIILVVSGIGIFAKDPRWVRVSEAAKWALFVIIGIQLFWSAWNQ